MKMEVPVHAYWKNRKNILSTIPQVKLLTMHASFLEAVFEAGRTERKVFAVLHIKPPFPLIRAAACIFSLQLPPPIRNVHGLPIHILIRSCRDRAGRQRSFSRTTNPFFLIFHLARC